MVTGLSQLRWAIKSHAYFHGYDRPWFVCDVTVPVSRVTTEICWRVTSQTGRSSRIKAAGAGEGSAWMLPLRHMTGPFAVGIDWCNLEVSKILYTALALSYFSGSMTATPSPYQQTAASVFSAQEQQRMDLCQSVPTGRDRLPISTASWMPCWRAFRLADGPHSNVAWSGGII